MAGAADLEPVAALFLACWRRSYRPFLPQPIIDAFDEDSALELWRGTITDPPAGATVLVADHDELGVVGVIRLGSDPDEPAAGHVFSLYVHPDGQGLGIGQALLREADAHLRRGRRASATLWVFAANEHALGFYERMGWHPDGATRIEPAYGEPELRLRRDLR